MRSFVRAIGRWPSAGWLLPLVLLTVSSCFLNAGPYEQPEFDPGPAPHTDAIMCDIPKPPAPGSNGCADSIETGSGISKESAAVALAQGEQSSIALDFSADAETECGGYPRKVEYYGPFPDGYAACLNCGAQMPSPYPNANAACIAVCIDLVNNAEGTPPPEGAVAFCTANAHVSTNFDATSCFHDACGAGGTLSPNFSDPRRAQEPVEWVDLLGTSATGNDLTRTLPGAGAFEAGGASKQTIEHGDGWVEFEAGESDLGHMIGLSPDPGSDADPSAADIAFAIRLGGGGKVAIFENGQQIGGSVGTYEAGDRFRVQVEDNLDGTAAVSYVQLSGPCAPGTNCSITLIATSANVAKYPLRVDASLNAESATLKNVTLVRIK